MGVKPFPVNHDLLAADVNDLVGILERSTAAVDVVNTAASTNLYSVSLAANSMSIDRMVRVTVLGDYLNNTGSSQTLSLAVVLNATIMWQDLTTATIPTDVDRRPFVMEFYVANVASASVQILRGTFWLGAAVAGSGAGIGDIDGSLLTSVFGGSAAENTALARTLSFSAQHGAANANLSIRKTYALTELC